MLNMFVLANEAFNISINFGADSDQLIVTNSSVRVKGRGRT